MFASATGTTKSTSNDTYVSLDVSLDVPVGEDFMTATLPPRSRRPAAAGPSLHWKGPSSSWTEGPFCSKP